MWLKEFSNFYLPEDHPGIVKDFIWYPSVEHFFAAMKTEVLSERLEIAAAPHPAAAKKLGKGVTLRKDWYEVRRAVSWYGVTRKFLQYAYLADLLVSTAPEPIVHEVHWHDNFWASCVCDKCQPFEKQNVLGEQLMKLRNMLLTDPMETVAANILGVRKAFFGTPVKRPA